MSLRKRYRLTPSLDRLQIQLNSLPEKFNADSHGDALRILNALDAALDNLKRAHKLIADGVIDA